MRWPWARSNEDRERAERSARYALSHLRVLVAELESVTERIKAEVSGD